ncbi:MAG: glutamate--tRNA ligase [Gemmatimonadetes bacterium]|nr:glutamate--tRNA ligase [Gemmatimonadota bacterium]MDA1104047.1 glutamate--tRNA ligase [Gemmatimonadota bacterium]
MRLRFAPSPTGYLHVGGARTAIFNWLLAKKEGAVFVLRIEDTDRERSSDEHTRAILDGMSWLGLDWDEGPIFQSEGIERHKRDALRLLDEGKAYRDFSDPDQVRAEAQERGMHPSRVAREQAEALGAPESERRATAGEMFAVRFRVPDGETRFTDMVHGEMRFGNDDVDDLIILRSDGTPVYNLAVVSDDADMRITHVIRGDDHLSNTPKQVLLYRALGFPEPVFAHVPLILGTDGKRLSKRHGATAVGDYASEGVLPDAMVNFLSLLGWSPGDDREFMTRAELIEAFDPSRILKKSSVFDADKLSWLNGRHLAAMSPGDLCVAIGERLGPEAVERMGDEAWRQHMLEVVTVRARTLDELADQARPFVCAEVVYDPDAVAKHWGKEPALAVERLERLAGIFGVVDWSHDGLETALRELAAAMGTGAGKLIHPLRVALTGNMASPGIFDVLVLLGRDRTAARIAQAIERIRAL